MEIIFVQNDKEKAEANRAFKAAISVKKAKVGTWILPPNLSKYNKFTVVDSDGRDVFFDSFDTIDGALLYALSARGRFHRIKDLATKSSWDRPGALTDWGDFV